MNEFQRRLLDAVQEASWISAVARENREILAIDYYNYNAEFGTLAAAGGTEQQIIQIQSDSDFALTYMSGAATNEAGDGVDLTPLLKVQITDTGTGKTFFSAPTLFPLVMGTGGLPFYLPAPRVVAPNTNLQINLENVNATAAYNAVYVNLLGARIYYK